METRGCQHLQELQKYLSDHGFFPPEIPIDQAKIYRFQREGKRGKRNAWLIAFGHHAVSTGKEYLVCVFGDWSTDEEFTFKSGGIEYSENDLQLIKKTIAEKRRKAEKEKLAFQKEAQKDAEEYLLDSLKEGQCLYLEKKGFTSGHLYGASLYRGLADKPCTVVPMRNIHGTLWGLQRIYADGTKFFLPGQKTQELFHALPDTDPLKENFIILCEGFATGASIHEATKKTVLVCFSASNLEKVALVLKKENPDCAILIAGDSDDQGKEAASRAAIRALGKAVYPEFPFGNDGGTDFNDLHEVCGLESVKTQIEKVHVSRSYIRCLGHKEGAYFYTSSDNQEITALKTHGAENLLGLMPLSYWGALYAKKEKIDWLLAASELKARCHEKGIFSLENVRGHGVWRDDGHVVVHLGDRLSDGHRELGIHETQSLYHYELLKSRQPLSKRPLILHECAPIAEFLNCLCLEAPHQKILLGGWIIASQLSGILSWRPHLFLSAEAGSGKSTLVDLFIRPLMGENVEFVAGDKTTEAGIRQLMHSSAVPLLLDEFDPYGRGGTQKTDAVLSLLRQASSGTGKIVQGSSNAKHVEYMARFCALISAIHNTSTNRQADATRFLQVEMKKPKDRGQWDKAQTYLGQFTPEYAARLFARIISKVDVFQKNSVAIQAHLANSKSQRFAQLYAPALAGWALLVSDKVLNQDEKVVLCDAIDIQETKETDHESCLEHLLGQKILIETGHAANLSTLIAEENNSTLGLYGLKVIESGVFIQTNHPQIKAFFKNTDWELSYSKLLRRLLDTKTDQRAWIADRTVCGIVLTLRNVRT